MKVLFLGHSLIEYYDWQRRFPEHAVENLGVAGETTAALLRRIDGIADRHPHPDAVFVMTGTNDLFLAAGDLPDRIGEAARKLRRRYPGARIVLQSILPVDPEWVPPSRIREVNGEIAGLAAVEGVEYLDLTGAFADEAGRIRDGVLLDDGVHLSDLGYRFWSGAVAKTLAKGGAGTR